MTEPRTSTPPRISNDPPSTDIAAAVRQVLGDSLGFLYPAALRVAVRLRIADHLTDGPHTAHHLAELTNAHPGHLNRILRYLATRGVFRQDDTGAFHLTPAAALLRAGSPIPVRTVVLQFTDPAYWLPAGRLEDTVRTGKAVHADIFGAQFFQHLAGDEVRGEAFSDAMAMLSATEQGAIAESYVFPGTGEVVDVGGGTGGMLHAVLTRNPGLHGVLFDREPVVSRNVLATDPAVAGRFRTECGDFFAGVPHGADFYLLKRILHDKTDDDCVSVLRSCRRAMSGRSRLLVIDAVIPADPQPHPHMISDILMLAVFEGRERTEQEFTELLADAGLRLGRVISTGSALSLIEAIAN